MEASAESVTRPKFCEPFELAFGNLSDIADELIPGCPFQDGGKIRVKFTPDCVTRIRRPAAAIAGVAVEGSSGTQQPAPGSGSGRNFHPDVYA